ncbi:G-D-S-L family lipolytic protein [Chryseobacterium arthrosphaerae]|uniref:G-D-S-L family lipolytic protein n=1 Tax=Chryseobacterium arthrosphaerae TaxID=651561 RepID=UPI001E2E32CA|nr:G-D-S-L family lipolytic protein [Chryseobacterium arthrosphaerae]MDG4651699.1 G-D-S-L family lipolytic protein [Chryseobacterium arthrosphaerae]UEQ75317.1 G-D-S-L family lipolytic protein [Chryseobacterium arthrosphaerae]
MKKIIISTIAVSALLFTVTSCKTDFDTDVKDIQVSKGSADFTRYVALGNSLTSGYRDGALYIDGQNESYPSMIAQQMKLVGGGEFKQPLMADNNGGLILATSPTSTLQIANTKLYIKGFVDGSPELDNANGNVATTVVNTVLSGPFNNLGVPGAKVAHLLAPGYGNVQGVAPKTANPYFVRFASEPNTSVIADFKKQNPTFFSLWIGNNDALLYALAGADSSVETLTPPAQFAQYYNMLIDQIASTNAKGVIANIPSVTSVPALTTIPTNPLTAAVLGKGNVAAGEAAIDDLNKNVYGPLSQILTALGAGDRIKPLSKTAANPLLIKDESITNLGAQITAAAAGSGNPTLVALSVYLGATYGQARQAKAGDLIPLTTKAAIGTLETLPPGIPASLGARGVAYPFADKYVLIPSEITEINTAIDAYNVTIKAAATAKGYAFVDANAKLKELSNTSGIVWDGVKYTAKFVSGGAFSLDGVHLTGRGYGVIANEFIKAINAGYNSSLPQVDPNKYSGVKFP